MGAVLSIEEHPEKRPNSRFTIPLRSTIQAYMREKMQWPDSFCEYYAEKFWNHYQSQGWVLSNGNPMKDWKAAFNTNWQNPKFKEDQEMLSKAIAAERKEVDPLKYLNECLVKHRSRQYKPSREECIGVYDYLKAKGLMKLPKVMVDKVVEEAGNSREKGKMLAVKYLFDKMVMEGKLFV